MGSLCHGCGHIQNTQGNPGGLGYHVRVFWCQWAHILRPCCPDGPKVRFVSQAPHKFVAHLALAFPSRGTLCNIYGFRCLFVLLRFSFACFNRLFWLCETGRVGTTPKDYTKPRRTKQSPPKTIQRHNILNETRKY